ncbi:MAG: DUF1028 domain-containing protein [Flavobacteriaceae bacterium]|jgi:uncharacterized Ntn-hydrolase superfamily protein|nr:DUF1028 domain-containing protein [Flavobacteriaceae bacterium]MDG1064099.1 DUF1028 domain-containing protein [Flavobacteriaceae bacterium]MDG1961778.1 DUF1028 domain-containing protein [Flavobacteriaceae bacterium]
MKKYFTALCIVASLQLMAQDTFSIIALDPETGEIGSAGASCINIVNSNWDTWITDIIPGRGGVNSQAYVCIPNVNLEGAIARMAENYSPQEIIDWLMLNDACGAQNFNPDYRQYGIVDFDGMGGTRSAGFTGPLTDDYKEDRQGATYSIQGNILLNASVIDQMEENFNNTSGTLADRLMAALQGANFPGADSRCLASGTSSRAAYMVVYGPDNLPGAPDIRLVVPAQTSGIEPIDLLQGLYDDLTLDQGSFSPEPTFQLWPNPTKDFVGLKIPEAVIAQSIEIFDINGKQVLEKYENFDRIDARKFRAGLYLIKVYTNKGRYFIKFIKQ